MSTKLTKSIRKIIPLTRGQRKSNNALYGEARRVVFDEIVTFLNRTVLGCEAKAPDVEVGDRFISIFPDYLLPVCGELKKSRWAFTTLEVISGIDREKAIEVNYMLTSFTKLHDLILKISLPKKGPELPEVDSLASLWSSANWQERECYDLLGVKFRQHPDLRRILCPDDWEGHPLRKDYTPQEKFHGMVVNPPDKINTGDHSFCENLKKSADDPKRVIGSWKLGESDDKPEDTENQGS